MFTYYGMSDTENGWKEMSRMEHWYSDDDENWEITAKGQYVVEIIKLPESAAPDSVPKSYSSKGWQVVGPFSLNKGTATFKFDFQNTASSGCSVSLKDGKTGNLVFSDDYKSGTLFTNDGGETQFNVPADGVYYIEVNTNGNNDWQITIEQ